MATQFSADEIKRFKARRQAELRALAPTPAPAQQKTSGRGGFLTSLISEIAGTGGALGGAAAGAAAGSVVPGLGTVVGGALGGLLGGFGGGTVGRVAENVVRDDRIGLDDALKEGALSGAFGGLGGGFRAAKGLKTAAKGISRTDKIGNIGDDLVAKSRGITPGMGQTATRPGLSIKEANRLNKFLDDIKINAKTPKGSLRQIEAEKASTLAAREDILKSAGRLPKGTISNIQKEIRRVVAKTPGINSVDDIAPDLKKLSNQRSVKGLTSYRQKIDGLINFNRSSATPDPKFDRMYKVVRRSIDKELTKVNPALKRTNTKLSNIDKVEELVRDATKKQEAGTGAYKIPIAGTKLPGGTTQSLQATTGRGLSGLSGALEATRLPRQLAAGTTLRGLANQDAQVPGTQQAPLQDVLLDDQSLAGEISLADAPAPNTISEALADPSIQQQLMLADLLDPNSQGSNMSKLEAIFALVAPPEVGKEGKLTSEQQKQAFNAQSGLRDVITLRSELQNDPTIAAKAALPFDSLTNRITGAGQFETAQRNIIDALARLRSGAAITDFEFESFSKMVPQTFDSPELVDSKLQRLEQLFSSFANPVPATQSTNLAELGVF